MKSNGMRKKSWRPPREIPSKIKKIPAQGGNGSTGGTGPLVEIGKRGSWRVDANRLAHTGDVK